MDNVIDVRLFKGSDLYLVPLCLAILFAIAYMARSKYQGMAKKKYFFPAIWWRLVFVVLYGMVIQYYYGYGDTIMYYRAVLDLHQAVSDDTGNLISIMKTSQMTAENPAYVYLMYDGSRVTHYYMAHMNNFNVVRFALPFSLLFGGSYLAISFCLSLFSFAGCWRIFKMFSEMYPQLERKFAIATLFLPSILFWGGSLLKDSICLGAMGFLLYAGYQVFIKKRKILVSLLILVLSALILFYIKPYILLCIVPAFLMWIFLNFRSRIVNSGLRRLTGILLLIISVVGGAFLLEQLTASEAASQYSSEKILETAQSMQGTFSTETEGAGSNFSTGDIGDSFASLLLMFPLGIITTFFRPFLWEIRSPLMLISAAEAFAFLYLTYMLIRKVGFKTAFSIAAKDSTVLFCLIFSFAFAGIIGITTTNFGALARYKIPCLPFFLFTLFIIMHRSGKFPAGYIFSRKFV